MGLEWIRRKLPHLRDDQAVRVRAIRLCRFTESIRPVGLAMRAKTWEMMSFALGTEVCRSMGILDDKCGPRKP